jgi:hypothetical protein
MSCYGFFHKEFGSLLITDSTTATKKIRPVAELFNYAYLCPLPLTLCLLKPIAHVCTLKRLKMG